jgi:signal peptidase I
MEKKLTLVPASRKKRIRANLIDMVVFLAIVLTVVSLNLGIIDRLSIVGAYFFILFPFLLFLGGSIGHRIMNLHVRQNKDYTKNISIQGAYLRVFFLITSAFVGIFNFYRKDKFLFENLSNTVTLEIDYNSSDNSFKDNQNRKSRIYFAIAAILYLLWVIWVGSFWLLLGLPIIFDIYVTKKVNWTPWKKRNQKNHTVVEWIDALIFAVVAVTLINIFFFQNYKIPTGSMEKTLLIGDHLYVSKLKYGPKIPNTPIAFPFTQNILPFTTSTKSYINWPNWGYKRLLGFSKIKNDDIVVFNFPEGDTVAMENTAAPYYSIVRETARQLKMMDQRGGNKLKSEKEYYALGRQEVWNRSKIIVHPVDRRDNYIKRCVAIAGDTLRIIASQVYINGKPEMHFEDMQFVYRITTDGSGINPEVFEKLGVYNDPKTQDDVTDYQNGVYDIPLTEKAAQALRQNVKVKSVEKLVNPYPETDLFPHSPNYPWKLDDFGPLWIPKKGVTIKININNLCLYDRIINAYEGNKLEVKDSIIYINDKPATTYTFKMDYYWMMGDNRHKSSDCRYWGFVPEDHIVGSPRFIWLSLDPTKSFPANIRWKRMFTSATR